MQPFGQECVIINENGFRAGKRAGERAKSDTEAFGKLYDQYYSRILGYVLRRTAGINKARVVIADLSGKNPNVFYETGIAHTVGKEVVIITQNIEDVPFDLRHLRHIQYQITPRGMRAFEKQLRNTLITILGRPPTST